MCLLTKFDKLKRFPLARRGKPCSRRSLHTLLSREAIVIRRTKRAAQ